jgi:hypothetical protein
VYHIKKTKKRFISSKETHLHNPLFSDYGKKRKEKEKKANKIPIEKQQKISYYAFGSHMKSISTKSA